MTAEIQLTSVDVLPTRRKPNDSPRVTSVIDGVDFDAMTESDVIAAVLAALSRGHGGILVTPNIDILRQLRQPANRDIARGADLVVADGMPVVWASKLSRRPLPERVAGSALIFSLSMAASGADRTVFVLGGRFGVAQRAADHLAASGSKVAGWHFPPFGFENDPAATQDVIDAIEAAGPDVVFVGLGFPKQERLILQLRKRFPSTWFVGCGGAITMAAGDIDRAPSAMQRFGLEWVHRLVKEPRRLARRYLVNDVPYTVGLLARSAATGRMR
jgi:N-acetylglucosaminyldiphosphoundecaprenol N-acetyl-beta-D-mannosaminyltransferase